MTRRRATARAGLGAAALFAGLAVAACDDQMKRIPFFKTMSWQESVEAYEEPARGAVAGTMPIDGERSHDLLAADTLLANPLAGTEEELARGATLFRQFCTPCHGVSGDGDGPAVGPNRIPDIPLLDLHSDLARSYSDGYVWGIITNGRGLMPPYRRIPADERWHIVAHVRRLQAEAAAEAADAEEAASVETTAAATAADRGGALPAEAASPAPGSDPSSGGRSPGS